MLLSAAACAASVIFIGYLTRATPDPKPLGASPKEDRAHDPRVQARRLRAGGADFDALTVPFGSLRVEVRYLDARGVRYGNLEALRRDVEAGGHTLVMAMNGGMFAPDHRPVGVLVAGGRELSPLDLSDSEGNFYLKPNGVFIVDSDFRTRIVPSEDFSEVPKGSVSYATQSGPLLLWQGSEHRAIRPRSTSRYIRNAVGTSVVGTSFVISRDEVTFHELVLALRELRCDDALYLDGSVSKMYAPALERFDKGGDFGPIVAVIREPEN